MADRGGLSTFTGTTIQNLSGGNCGIVGRGHNTHPTNLEHPTYSTQHLAADILPISRPEDAVLATAVLPLLLRRLPTSGAPSASALSSQSKTHTHAQSTASGTAPGAARGIATSTPVSTSATASTAAAGAGSVMNQLNPIHSPRAGHHGGMPIPAGAGSGHRRGSDSSTEGFRDARGADKWYIGGRTAGGEEKFFKLGVVKRVRSNDRLSLDRLSL
ncbi:hypothetical protein PG999_009844 [Apiospora kogelbergensis]|uniref:Uncharacterized protein n=1 Tax=Apiospora kogelbergensis TaxID=1337665 RepID=A0AAW0QVG8_9PEZI